ncbi:sugar kinase [soil metagenome]
MRPPEVLVIGDANPDLVLTGDPTNLVPQFGQVEKLVDSADLVLGGSAAIAACGLARLGVPTALAALVGDDFFGEFVRRELTAAGVDTRWVRTDPAVATALSVVLSAGDRAILTFPGALAATGPDVVDRDLLNQVRHVHSASMFLQPRLAPHLPDIFAAARSGGATTSLDTNWDPAELWHGVFPLLENTDIVFPNTAELIAMTGCADVDGAAERVLELGCRVALKDGASGGRLWEPGRAVIAAPASATDAVDTTGAGDSFDAGYISAMIEGRSGADCLARAVVCGSLSTRSLGGTAAQARRADL